MRVEENPSRAAAILENAERYLDSEREPGWHVSDLTSCLRKAWFKKNRPDLWIPDSPEDRAVFLLGKSQHAMLQAAGMGSELRVVLDLPTARVHGTVDVYAPGSAVFGDVPAEIKTTRSNDLKEPAFGMPQYIEQLASYCLATRNTAGTLAVWYIFATPPVLRVWDIVFGVVELDMFRAELDCRLQIVSQSDTIPLLGEHRRGECKSCPYLKKGCEGDLDGGREHFFDQHNYTAWA